MNMRRLAASWRLAASFARESRAAAPDTPGRHVLRAIASHASAADPTSFARVPALYHLSALMSQASRAAERHPALTEAAVRVALDEFRSLATPHSSADFQQALQAALPDFPPIDALSATPLRCGIAEQTHTARIGAAPVRITLIHGETRARLADDLDLAMKAARLAERYSRQARELDVAALVGRTSVSINAMLDLRQRAADQSYLRYKLREDERLVVAEVLWDQCSDTVLTTRAIRGVRLSDAAALSAHGLVQSDLIATLIEAFFEMAMNAGVYHAGLDAASATVSVEPDSLGQIVLDADTPVAFFAAHERDFLVLASDALFRGDHKAAAREHLEHGRPASGETHREVKVEATYRREAERFAAAGVGAGVTSNAARAPHAASVAELFGALSNTTREHAYSDTHGAIASRAALLSRSVERIEDMARDLAPGVNVSRIARKVIARLAADQFGRHGVLAQLAKEIVHWPHALPRVPNLLADWLASEQRAGSQTIR